MYKQREHHGMSKKPEYQVWQDMRQRCHNQKSTAYKYYGGRGIVVCERWQEFTNFNADMGDRPSPKHTIDRIDTNGPYAPDNCRWATRLDQQRNTRRSRSINVNGQSVAIGEAAARSGFCRDTIVDRVNYGLTPDQAMSLPRFHPSVIKRIPRSSQYTGVVWDSSRSKWMAFIKVNGKMKNLGRFDDEKEAALCRDRFCRINPGTSEFLNFPAGWGSDASKARVDVL